MGYKKGSTTVINVDHTPKINELTGELAKNHQELSKYRSEVVNVKGFNASGSSIEKTGSIASGSTTLKLADTTDFKEGQTVYVPKGGVLQNEVVDLIIDEGASADGNITITLDGMQTSIPVTNGMSASDVGAEILNTSFSGWNVSKVTVLELLNTNLRFTATTTGDKGTHSFSGGTTGTTAKMNVVTEGIAPLISKITSVNGNDLVLENSAVQTVTNQSVKHDDTQAIQSVIDSAKEFSTIELSGFFNVSQLVITKPLLIDIRGEVKQLDYTNDHFFLIQNTNDVYIRGRIDGNRDKQRVQNNWSAIHAVNSAGIKVIGAHIESVAGNGVMFDGTNKSVVRHSYIGNIAKCAVRVANVGADDNSIEYNFIIDVEDQNGIFFTAKNDSTNTSNYIRRNKAIGNTIISVGDVGIESGQRCVASLIANNTIFNSRNIGVLVRDNLDTVVDGNMVDNNNRKDSEHFGYHGIAVYRHNSTVSECRVIIINNTVMNTIQDGCYVNENARVSVISNKFINIGLAAVYLIGSSHIVKGNEMLKVGTGISFDGRNVAQSGTGTNCEFAHIEDNLIEDIKTDAAILLKNKVLNKVSIKRNTIKLVDLTKKGIDATGSTIGVGSYCYDNPIVDTSTPQNNNVNLDIFIQSPNGSWGSTVPLTQYSNLTLAKNGQFGTVKLQFGSSWAILDVFPQSGSGDGVGYMVRTSSSDIHDTITGINDGWGITKTAGGDIILQRRGLTITGNQPYKRILDIA